MRQLTENEVYIFTAIYSDGKEQTCLEPFCSRYEKQAIDWFENGFKDKTIKFTPGDYTLTCIAIFNYRTGNIENMPKENISRKEIKNANPIQDKT